MVIKKLSTPPICLRGVVTVSLSALLLTGCTSPVVSPPASNSAITSDTATQQPSSTSPVPPSSPKTVVPTSSAPAVPMSWPEVVAEVQSGVGQLSVTGCSMNFTGTGFMVAPDLVVTAAHVVDDAAAISVNFGNASVGGVILGFNELADLALVRLDAEAAGHKFQFQPTEPPIGTEVAALGFPRGESLTLTRGVVSGLDRDVDFGSGVIGDMLQTDTALNPGNSGGPLLNLEGKVTGVVSATRMDAEGMSYAVTAPRVAEAVAEWQERGVPMAPVDCGEAPAPNSGIFPMKVSSNHDQANNIGQALLLHGQGINRGAYAAAFKQFTPELGASFGGEAKWSEGLGSSYWTELEVVNVTGVGDALVANVLLQTRQDAGHGVDGQTCSNWRIAYTMVWDGAAWRIAKTSLPHGKPQPCN
jgi:serine protease Do